MRLDLPYGTGLWQEELPELADACWLEASGSLEPLADLADAVDSALESPIGCARLRDRLAHYDTHVFHRVVRVHIQIARGVDLEINQSVPGNLGQHVLKKRQTSGQPRLARTIQIQGQLDTGFLSVALDPGNALAAHNGTCQWKSAQYTFVRIECPVPWSRDSDKV